MELGNIFFNSSSNNQKNPSILFYQPFHFRNSNISIKKKKMNEEEENEKIFLNSVKKEEIYLFLFYNVKT